ncbi:hypothetical protein, partial [Azospira oryzae]|uniref:hypothetical protein n=1 Tax=Azospira oryzae TaxID=146939 RepID=UPI00196619EB
EITVSMGLLELNRYPLWINSYISKSIATQGKPLSGFPAYWTRPRFIGRFCRLLLVRATTPMFTFKTAMLFWLVAASVPLLTSLVYFRASPSTESLIQRIAVSLHGVAISALCVGAVLVGMLGAPRPELGDIFRFLLFVPITLVIYSFWRFQGKRSIHLLQGINLLWLALAFFFGGMAVTGVWL